MFRRLQNRIFRRIAQSDGASASITTIQYRSHNISASRFAIRIGRHAAKIAAISHYVNLSRIFMIFNVRTTAPRHESGPKDCHLTRAGQIAGHCNMVARTRYVEVHRLGYNRIFQILSLSRHSVETQVFTGRLHIRLATVTRLGFGSHHIVGGIIINSSVTFVNVGSSTKARHRRFLLLTTAVATLTALTRQETLRQEAFLTRQEVVARRLLRVAQRAQHVGNYTAFCIGTSR